MAVDRGEPDDSEGVRPEHAHAEEGSPDEGSADEYLREDGEAADDRAERAWAELAWTERAEARVDAWLAGPSAEPGDASAAGEDRPDLLTGVRRDAEGFDFTRRLLESIAGEGDPFAAALALREASRQLPPSLPARDRLAVRAGGLASLGLPWAVLPVARRWLRDRVAHLVLSVRTPDETKREGRLGELREALAAGGKAGFTTVLLSAGDPVLGPAGVEVELARLAGLAAEPSVTHLAVDPARIAPGGDWSLDADAEAAALALRPVLEAARDHGTVLVFAPSDFRGARLVPEILVRALADPALDGLGVGAQLLAELPESRAIAERLIRWAGQRVAEGGAPLELAVVVGGITARERIASVLSGLPVPTLDTRAEQAAQWLRLVGLVLDAPSGTVAPVAASEDPHLLAAAVELAEARGLGDDLAVQLRAGTASALADALVREGRTVRLLLPLVPPREFAGAVELLLALAAEAADPESALARSAELVGAVRTEAGDEEQEPEDPLAPAALVAERAAFRTAAALSATPFPTSHRVQLRAREWDPSERDSALFYRPPADPERLDTGGLTAAVLGLSRVETGEIAVAPAGPPLRVPVVSASGFANEPDTDAVPAENRAWVRRLLERAAASRAAASAAAPAAEDADPAPIVDRALAAAEPWRAQAPRERAVRLRRLALGAAAARDRLFEAIAVETGDPVPVIDAAVNGAIDAARYLGQLAEGIGAVRGADFRPDRLALVVAEAGVPLEERAEAVLAALAAGSAVVLAVDPGLIGSSVALVEEWQAAGLPAGLVGLIPGVGDEAAALAADPRVDRALVLGNRDTALGLIRRRPDLRVEGRFRAPGTVLVSPTADPAAAAEDAVRSAFGTGAGSARSARVLIVFGSAARSRRFRQRLADAVRAIRPGDTAAPSDGDPLAFGIGPLPQPPGEAGLRALTELDSGEEWLVQPECLDGGVGEGESSGGGGRLWRPGVRTGLRRDARFWRDAVGMPVIGVITARTLDEALELQRELGGGGVAALHAGAPEELIPWLERTHAASLVVGRPTGPERIERLPGGGWGDAGMGVQTLAGGPSRLVTLGSWELREGTPSGTLHLRGLDPEVQVLIEAAQQMLDYESFDRVRRAALSDALSWRTTLGRVHDEIGLGVERNLLRRWPAATQIRLAERAPLAALVRVLAAALLVRAPVTVSTGAVLPRGLADFLASQGIPVSLERDDDWLERIAVEASAAGSDGGSGGGSGSGPGQGPALESRVRLIGGDAVRTAEWLGGQSRVAVWAEPVTMAGPVELLAFLREQSISITVHRYGLLAPPAGLEEWIAELDERSAPGA